MTSPKYKNLLTIKLTTGSVCLKCNKSRWCSHVASKRKDISRDTQALFNSPTIERLYFLGIINFHIMYDSVQPKGQGLSKECQDLTRLPEFDFPLFSEFQQSHQNFTEKEVNNPKLVMLYATIIFNIFFETKLGSFNPKTLNRIKIKEMIQKFPLKGDFICLRSLLLGTDMFLIMQSL